MRDKTKPALRSARLVRRAGTLHLVLPRAVWKQVGIGASDTVEIQCRNGCVVFALGKEVRPDTEGEEDEMVHGGRGQNAVDAQTQPAGLISL